MYNFFPLKYMFCLTIVSMKLKVVVSNFLNAHWFSIHNSLQYKMVLVLKKM
jgi:hypothetical protein